MSTDARGATDGRNRQESDENYTNIPRTCVESGRVQWNIVEGLGVAHGGATLPEIPPSPEILFSDLDEEDRQFLARHLHWSPNRPRVNEFNMGLFQRVRSHLSRLDREEQERL